MKDIAKKASDTRAIKRDALRKLVIVTMSLPFLAGCVSDDLGLTPDTSIKTATTPGTQKSISDEMTVRNAVSSADLAKLEGSALPWANSSTGSAGVVEQISEISQNGTVCRDFVTTSHSYEGISKFRGRACLLPNGEWQMVSFDKQG